MNASGWLLDCYLKSGPTSGALDQKDDGAVQRLVDTFHPSLFIEPTTTDSGIDLHRLLTEQPVRISGMGREEEFAQ